MQAGRMCKQPESNAATSCTISPKKRKHEDQETPLTALKCLASVDPRAAKRQQLPTPPLLGLPPEIVQHIATFLPVTFAAVFALSCKAVRNTIGPRWEELQHPSFRAPSSLERDAYREFLEKIAQDSPDYLLCKFCCLLHRWDIDDRPGANAMLGPPVPHQWCHIADGGLSLCGEYNIDYKHVKLAMRRHRLGELWGILLDNFSCHRPVVHPPSDLRLLGKKDLDDFRARVKIVDDNLFIEIQFTVWLGEMRSVQQQLDRYGIQICVHDNPNLYNHLWFQDQLLEHLKSGQSTAPDQISTSQCAYCPTEFSARWTGLFGNIPRAEISIWKCLGAGGEKRDWKWMSLISEAQSSYRAYNLDRARFPLGSIRGCFYPQGIPAEHKVSADAESGAAGGGGGLFEKHWAKEADTDEAKSLSIWVDMNSTG
ncbi:MAG: hypothetical protein MMC33_009907 [Icmadophila ericetorum]|nr:hypothetical protein [Icmadophila ericetorum]